MSRFKLVVTDVDGTLVQPDKTLAASTIAAAARLKDAGLILAVVSARPPRGIVPLASELGGGIAVAGFNGGTVIGPDGAVLLRNVVPEHAARTARDMFAANGVSTWLFTGDEWLLTDVNGPHILLERRTVRFNERVVDSFDPYLALAGKLVGVTDDFPLLERVEHDLQTALGATASAHRSQKYYCDVTHPDATKGNAVTMIAKLLGVDLADTAVLGDMPNDLPMFAVAGYAIAMGNAPPEVQTKAAAVTGRNDANGWAEAIDRYVLV